MVRKSRTLNFDVSKYEHYEDYCERTGRVLSRTLELAMDEYIRNNN